MIGQKHLKMNVNQKLEGPIIISLVCRFCTFICRAMFIEIYISVTMKVSRLWENTGISCSVLQYRVRHPPHVGRNGNNIYTIQMMTWVITICWDWVDLFVLHPSPRTNDCSWSSCPTLCTHALPPHALRLFPSSFATNLRLTLAALWTVLLVSSHNNQLVLWTKTFFSMHCCFHWFYLQKIYKSRLQWVKFVCFFCLHIVKSETTWCSAPLVCLRQPRFLL